MMKADTKIRVLWCVAIVQAVAIIAILGIPIRVAVVQAPADRVENPLMTALNYDAPIEKFEWILTKWPSWANYIEKPVIGPHGEIIEDLPMLARCALGGLTNHVRVLIRHGANTDRALKWLHENGSQDAVQLIIECKELEAANKAMDTDKQ